MAIQYIGDITVGGQRLGHYYDNTTGYHTIGHDSVGWHTQFPHPGSNGIVGTPPWASRGANPVARPRDGLDAQIDEVWDGDGAEPRTPRTSSVSGGTPRTTYGDLVYDPGLGAFVQVDSTGRVNVVGRPPAQEAPSAPADIRVQRQDGSIDIYDGATYALKSTIPADPSKATSDPAANYYITQTPGGGLRAIDKVTGKIMWDVPGTQSQTSAQSSGQLRNSPVVEAAQAALLAQQAAAVKAQSAADAEAAELQGDYVRAQIKRMEAQTAAERERAAIERATTYASLLNSVDLGALQSFLAAGGGSVVNAIASGANMLTPQALSPAAELATPGGTAPSPVPVGGGGAGGGAGAGGGTGGTGGAGGTPTAGQSRRDAYPVMATDTPGQRMLDTAAVLEQAGLPSFAARGMARYADPGYAAMQDAFYTQEMQRQAAMPPLRSAAQKAAEAAMGTPTMTDTADERVSVAMQPQAVVPMLAGGGMAKDMAIVGDPQPGTMAANPELVSVVGPPDAVQQVAIQARPVQLRGFDRAAPPPQMATMGRRMVPMLAMGGMSRGDSPYNLYTRERREASGASRPMMRMRPFGRSGGTTPTTPTPGTTGTPDPPAPPPPTTGSSRWTPAGITGGVSGGTRPVSSTSPMIPGITQAQIDRSLIDRTNAPTSNLNVWGTDFDNADPVSRAIAMQSYQRQLGIPVEVVEFQRQRRALRPFAGAGRVVGY